MQKYAEKDAPPEDSLKELAEIGAADLVVGIPTYNNRETVAAAVSAAVEAKRTHFSGLRVAFINADGSSRDGTPEYIREAVGGDAPLLQTRYPVYPVHRLTAPLAGVPGRREAAVAIFDLARKLDSRACVLVDADEETLSPEWIHRMAKPVLDGRIDLMLPSYLRQKFDGLIIGGILSPLTRALFGKRLRQPGGTDIAFSAALMDFYINETNARREAPVWLDPWSAVPAICHGFRIGQTFLGRRVVRQREVAPDLSDTLLQVLSALFDQIEHTAGTWQKIRGSEAVPWFGPPFEIDVSGREVNLAPMIESFRLGVQDLAEIWNRILPPATLLELRRLMRQAPEAFQFPDELWARVIYDFALNFHLRTMDRDHLIGAITPLYLGWVASFTRELLDANAFEVEQRFERLATHFEAQKKYFIARWRWPDRFNP